MPEAQSAAELRIGRQGASQAHRVVDQPPHRRHLAQLHNVHLQGRWGRRASVYKRGEAHWVLREHTCASIWACAPTPRDTAQCSEPMQPHAPASGPAARAAPYMSPRPWRGAARAVAPGCPSCAVSSCAALWTSPGCPADKREGWEAGRGSDQRLTAPGAGYRESTDELSGA